MRFLPILRATWFSSMLLMPLPAWCVDYHVDSTSGDDASEGTRPEKPWRSLEKVNKTLLQPGDKVLFKAGGRWTGQLKPQGSGNEKHLIHIGRYGEGSAPRIDGEGKTRDAVWIENQSFIEISDLHVTNQGPSPAPWRTGVRLSADGIGKMQRVYLRRLLVRDVNGDLRKSHEGCGIFFEATRKNDSHFDGLLIEGCHVVKTDRNGICQKGTGRVRSRNVIIRGNLLEDIGGDGIKLWGTDGGLIEKNVVRKARARCNEKEAAAGIWPFGCDDTIIQFNEVSGTMGTLDGQGFDADYWCRRTIFQYNYSFQNEGGFMLICSPGDGINDDTIIRYNISVHDGINSARVFHFGGGAKRTHVYNNTVVVGAHQDLPMMLFTEWNGGEARDSRFTNNLFIVEEGGRATYKFGPSRGNVFENNLFAGRHEGLPAGVDISAAPKFAGPLQAAPGFDSLKAFRPLKAIPGKVIDNNGDRDFFGKPLPRNQAPSIGALEP
jgi:hypothetical protein